MAEFKLGRLKFVWQGNWAAGTPYVKDDVVKYGARMYVCVTGHSSNANAGQGFYTDNALNRWEMMVDGANFRGAWSATTPYNVNDIITYGGIVYLCNTNHVSHSTLLESDQSKWTVHTKGFDWKGVYAHPATYKVNDLVRWGSGVYSCIVAHSTITAVLDDSKFALFVSGLEFEENWSSATTYQAGDVSKYGGNVYIANRTTVGDNPGDAQPNDAWDLFVEGLTPKGLYNNTTVYGPNDLVHYGANLYLCTVNTTGNVPTNTSFWSLWTTAFLNRGAWVAETTYYYNDIVEYGGNLYVCTQTCPGHIPTVSSHWALFVAGITNRQSWSTSTLYYENNLVQNGGTTFICSTEHTSAIFSNDLALARWQVFAAGLQQEGAWAATTLYHIDDIVQYGSSSYICIEEHTATTFPADNTSGYWSVFSGGMRYRQTWDVGTVYLRNDVVTSGSSAYIVIVDEVTGGGAPFTGTNTAFSMIAAGAEGFLALGGGTMTGPIVLAGDGTAPLHPVTKGTFDTGIANTLTTLNTAIAAISLSEIDLRQTVSVNTTLAANKISFSMETLTISGNAVYTINNGAYHTCLNPDGFAVFS